MREEGHYTVKRVKKLPIRGNANFLYTIKKEKGITEFHRWKNETKTYEIIPVGQEQSASISIAPGDNILIDNTDPENPVISVENSPTGLEAIDEGNGIGWRLIERDPSKYGNIGLDAIDFSKSDVNSNVNGSTGKRAFTFGLNNENSGESSLVGGDTNKIVGLSYSDVVFGANNIIDIPGNSNSDFTVANFVSGYQNKIESISWYSTVLGRNNTVRTGGSNFTNYSFTTGMNNLNKGRATNLLGMNLRARSTGATVVGMANIELGNTADSNSNGAGNLNEATNPMFIVGNGTLNLGNAVTFPTLNRSNAFVVLRNGEITAPSTDISDINNAGNKAITTVEWVNNEITANQIDTSNFVKKTGETSQNIEGEISHDGASLSSTITNAQIDATGDDSLVTKGWVEAQPVNLEGYNETGTKAGGDLVVEIGDYNNTGGDTILTIDDQQNHVQLSKNKEFKIEPLFNGDFGLTMSSRYISMGVEVVGGQFISNTGSNSGYLTIGVANGSGKIHETKSDYTVLFGLNNQIGSLSPYSIIQGNNNQMVSNNDSSGIIGEGNVLEATARHSFAVNINNTTSSENTFVAGRSNFSRDKGEFSIGVFGTDYVPTGGTSTLPGEASRLFNIGNGNSGASRSDALTVLKNGTITAPSLTNTKIDAAGPKAIPTVEWFQSNIPTIDTSNLVKKTGESSQSIEGEISHDGTSLTTSITDAQIDASGDSSVITKGYADNKYKVTSVTNTLDVNKNLVTTVTDQAGTVSSTSVAIGSPWLDAANLSPATSETVNDIYFPRNLYIGGTGLFSALSAGGSHITFGKPLTQIQSSETSYGVRAGYNSTSDMATLVGNQAGEDGTGGFISAFGYRSGLNNSGAACSFLGAQSGRDNSGNNVTAMGSQAGRGNTAASLTAVGESAGINNTGSSTTNVGRNAGNSNSGINQTAIGFASGQNNTGSNQTAIGNLAGQDNEGTSQVSIGYLSGSGNKAISQTSVGVTSGVENIGVQQTAVGFQTGRYNTGQNNTAIGARALKENTGQNNTAIGTNAGTEQSFTSDIPATVDNTNNTFTINSHGFGAVGEYVRARLNGTTAPGGMILVSSYVFKVLDANTLEVHGVDITSNGSDVTLNKDLGGSYENITAVGANAEATQSNQVMLGDVNVTQVFTYGDMNADAFVITSDERHKSNFTATGMTKTVNLNPINIYQYQRTYNGKVEIGVKAQDVETALVGVAQSTIDLILPKRKGVDWNATLVAINSAYGTTSTTVQQVLVDALDDAVKDDLEANGFPVITRPNAIIEFEQLTDLVNAGVVLDSNQQDRYDRFLQVDFTGMRVFKTYYVEVNDIMSINTTALSWVLS